MKKILFVYDHPKPEQLEGDGLWSALKLLEKDFEVDRLNLLDSPTDKNFDKYDFYLSWGALGSRPDMWVQLNSPKGLCLAAQMPVNETAKNYDVIFYETEWMGNWLRQQGLTKLEHAFGVNTDIFEKLEIVESKPLNEPDNYCSYPKIWDIISVGSFSPWHRQDLLYDLLGYNLAIGNVETDNIQESFNYVANLLMKGWSVSNFVPVGTLAKFYNMSKKAYLTAEFGQERACLEARACGLEVEVPEDNPKLKELKTSPIWDHHYYAQQLKKGILGVLG